MPTSRDKSFWHSAYCNNSGTLIVTRDTQFSQSNSSFVFYVEVISIVLII
jgi:hypothetical protein